MRNESELPGDHMTIDRDFQTKVQRIADLVATLEDIENPESRSAAKALVQLLLELHSTGLERMLEIVARGGDAGQRAIDELGNDALVSSLLVLYGLHPLDFESRVALAIEKVAPRVRKGGGEISLLSSEKCNVRVRLEVASHSCGSTFQTLKAMVEDAVYEAAPDAASLSVEGLPAASVASGFVPLTSLGSSAQQSEDSLPVGRL